MQWEQWQTYLFIFIQKVSAKRYPLIYIASKKEAFRMQSQCLSCSKQITTIRKQDYDFWFGKYKSVFSRQTQDAHARIYQLHRLRSLQKIPQACNSLIQTTFPLVLSAIFIQGSKSTSIFFRIVGLLTGLHINIT